MKFKIILNNINIYINIYLYFIHDAILSNIFIKKPIFLLGILEYYKLVIIKLFYVKYVG